VKNSQSLEKTLNSELLIRAGKLTILNSYSPFEIDRVSIQDLIPDLDLRLITIRAETSPQRGPVIGKTEGRDGHLTVPLSESTDVLICKACVSWCAPDDGSVGGEWDS
jgi:hypothetical protein